MPKSPKSSSRKTQTKRQRRARKKPESPKQHIVLRTLSTLVLMGALISTGYLIGANKKQTKHDTEGAMPPVSKSTPTKKATPANTAHPKKKKHPSPMDILRYGFAEDAQGDTMPDVSWYVPGSSQKPQKKPASKTVVTTPPPKRTQTPRLAIIIDDVSHKRQLDTIQALPYHITPSIFPPSELSATSNHLADALKHFMVHLPMESGSVAMNRMRGMLFIRDSAAKVQARVDEIRRLFPRAKYINNHTGSVFTSNYKAMKQLYGMLRQKGFVFVDSRTTGRSVVRKIVHAYHGTYIARDVFIDNTQTEAYVLKQLKQAVRIAKKRGFAIAIGHPHAVTMRALRHAGKILAGVKTVYIDELYH